MLQTMDESSDAAIGYTVIGEVGEADFQTLVPAVQAAIDKNGSINLLLDLTQFKWEKVEAWKSDLDFGQTYKNRIDKMALVGNAEVGEASDQAGPALLRAADQMFRERRRRLGLARGQLGRGPAFDNRRGP
jgi:hypothetical protein